MSGVIKATVAMTVYMPADDFGRYKKMSLDDIQYEVTEGAWIGSGFIKSKPVPVAKEDLRAELEAIGRDGSFFDEIDVKQLEKGYGS